MSINVTAYGQTLTLTEQQVVWGWMMGDLRGWFTRGDKGEGR